MLFKPKSLLYNLAIRTFLEILRKGTSMKWKKISALIMAMGLLMTISCTKHPSPAQMSDLEAAENAADAAQRQLSSLESEYNQLQAELEREKSLLSQNESEKAVVLEKLSK